VNHKRPRTVEGSGVLPRRREGLIVEDLQKETLVYDPKGDRMHCLNPSAALVFRHCDGKTPVSEVSRRLAKNLGGPEDPRLVQLTVQRLSKSRLLEPSVEAPGARLSRREVAKALGLTGASVLLPLVISVVAPTPASAATCLPFGGCCNVKADCCPGLNCQGPLTCSTGKQCR
jgi:hypothetical protein